MIEYKKISEVKPIELFNFFDEILNNNDDLVFHPHAFDKVTAEDLCSNYNGSDLYYVIYLNREVVGYGILRGWDEGYDIPSLGIILSKNIRGTGISKNFMDFLHLAAKMKGAKCVRLKVYKSNVTAINLYNNLGYRFEEFNDNTLLGHFDCSI